MADEDLEEEEEERTEIISQETMIEWERIQLPLDLNQSPSPSPAPDPFNGGWSMIDEDRPQIVFPPVNHEGLLIFSGSAQPLHDVREIDLDRVAPPSPLRIPPVGDAKGGWWDAGLELLRFKVAGIVCSIRNIAVARGFPISFHSLGYVAPLAGSMMFLLLYLRFRRRRRIRRESILDLIRVIKERDEEMLQKINQLLHQIARMNEFLLASHHRVPVPKAA